MHPILFDVGPMPIFSLSVFIVIAWLLFSFLFWKSIRSWAVPEEPVFDLMFYATFASLITARVAYILMYPEQFKNSVLLMVTPWVAPGLSFYGALVGGVCVMVVIARIKKIRVGMVLDALALSLPATLAVGEIGSLLDGSTVGNTTTLPWGVLYAGHLDRRHPIQLYEFIALFVIMLVVLSIQKIAKEKKLPYGVVGTWFFVLFSIVMFFLDALRETGVYWFTLSVNRWVLLAIFAEATGALYVRGGGREALRPVGVKIKNRLDAAVHTFYARIPKRNTR